MSSEDNKLKHIKNAQLRTSNETINNSQLQNNDEEQSFNNNLIKPIPINPKLIKNQKNDLNTLGNSSLSNKNQNSNLSIIYPKVNQLSNISNNSSLEEKNNLKISDVNKKSGKINGCSYPKENLCCNCTKTKCIKKYCECFAKNKLCTNCNCQDCMNKINYLDNNNMKYSNDNGIIICTCTKSNCIKKYCECFKFKIKCNEKCRCINCMNTTNENQKIINNNDIHNNDNKINKNNVENNNNKNNTTEKVNKKNKKNNKVEEINGISKEILNDDLEKEFKIQRISVFINKNHTLINVDKLNKEDMELLCKKRNHIHN